MSEKTIRILSNIGATKGRCLSARYGFMIVLAIFFSVLSSNAQVSALKGDGVTDDTAAMNAAIAQTCANGGSVSLPSPKILYKVTSTLKTPCRGIHIIGSDAKAMGQIDQFGFPPMVPIRMMSQEEGPVFAPSAYTTFENLDIEGYNQAVWVNSDVNVSFRNVCMSVNGTTGMPDNTPLKITNSFWIWFKGGCLMAKGSTTTPILLMTGEQSVNGQAPLNGLITIEDVTGAGGGMRYIQRVGQWGSAGNMTFRNILIEDITTDVLTMTAENGARYGAFNNLTFDRVSTSDGAPGALLAIGDPSLQIKGVFVNQSSGGSQSKIRGAVSGYFDTNGTFDTMSGNSLAVKNVMFGTTQLGLGPSGALSVFVPVYQPPSNVQVKVGTQPGTITGTHTYMVVAANRPHAEAYSEMAVAATSITLTEPSSVTVTWTPSPSNPGGYMIVRDIQYQGTWVYGALATTGTDIGLDTCCWQRPNIPTLVAKPILPN